MIVSLKIFCQNFLQMKIQNRWSIIFLKHILHQIVHSRLMFGLNFRQHHTTSLSFSQFWF
jgi:hypothetical protein